MEIEDIVFLEGNLGTDHREMFNELSRDYNCMIFDNLYKRPDKLIALKFLKPECLFIGTTGMFVDKIDNLIDYFNISEYIPKMVIFASENSAMALLGLARDLKEKGTKFYYKYDELEEIIWI